MGDGHCHSHAMAGHMIELYVWSNRGNEVAFGLRNDPIQDGRS